jgi:hypothetical protein
MYQKHYPLWGGITNMNLNLLWEPQDPARPRDYFRAVSTGPVTPLVFSFTTLGDQAQVALTYRSTVFSPGDIEQVQTGFLSTINALKN